MEKTTGMVRRIDELGRIVIPKEIRSSMHIKNNDKLELFVEKDKIILRKYYVLDNIKVILDSFLNELNNLINKNILITDNEKIIIYHGDNKNDYLNKKISSQLELSIKRRDNIKEIYKKNLSLVDNKLIECTYIIKSIILNGDVIGLLVIFTDGNSKINDLDEKISRLIVNFLVKYLED